MRTVAFVAALTALVAPASAFLWGCYPAIANSGTLNYTDAVGNSPNKCSNACITAHHGPAVLISGANCYCGSFPQTDSLDNSACNTPCPGSPYQKCGGPDGIISVYTSG